MKIISKLATKNNDAYNASPATIAFIGESVTNGCFECYFQNDGKLETVYDPQSAFANKIHKIFSILFPKAQINIINGGISGDNAPNGNKRFERDIKPFSPDLVVVGYGLNDCGAGEEGIEKYKQGLNGIFNQVKAIKAECIFLTPNMMNNEVSLTLNDERLANLAKVKMNDPLEKYVLAAKEVAKKNDVKICDIYSKWQAMAEGGVNITALLSNSINHPIRDMHWLTAISIVETMFS